MITPEENETMTRVGPGTPAGDLLRQYWQPVAAAAQLTPEKPIMAVRRLGEDLVVYRDTSGGYGLVTEKCPHRMASLAYGNVDEDGIRCPYHGWKFDCAGNCVEQPAEPKGSTFKDSIKHTAYPVQKLGGLLFAYFGKGEAPPLPRWDVLAWEHGKRWVQVHSLLECNWLQAMENSVDPSHLYWLHGKSAHLASRQDHYEEKHDFIEFDYGIMKRRTTPGKNPGDAPEIDQHPLVFPNTLRHVLKDKKNGNIRHNLQFRMPVDDTHTQVFLVMFEPSETESCSADDIAPMEAVNMRGEDGDYRMDMVLAQDAMAWETQGGIHDRSREKLGAADMGVAKYRHLVQEQIAKVLRGEPPMGRVRDGEGEQTIEFEVINERIGVSIPERQGAAK
ncbi:MAG: aromatic ring-hydroxylating dioxygenase subunit alpha [Rhodospirillales bacterium]|jgi:5,5'-dehydrodivanillate O-demethylase|nr:aromatic ring-hydroxylating dioxygenase subunit alpha [Rhodospirillales bacterium]MBT4007308.1 aromatic ring-hydroxylating dioxygenase subunit alpha [Rhodospirillales bacterium]MBT5076987.1 aromatic ring-hydroxylating dioxygenase subunit alpha [Rhodospirillales bacterium]MBT5113641.1 aromatic ring-hydroxylating dioxygenase subunit alpha [Rhodospirillales bacterium]MBT5673939.1 aromatic ring-hydroxylating dioxygenase subunit alpha [Rhodospirillales bacterium]